MVSFSAAAASSPFYLPCILAWVRVAQVPYFTYPGSFTTPPCTEAVTWVLLEKPISFAEEHIEKLKEAMGVNNRPVLPVNNRFVSR